MKNIILSDIQYLQLQELSRKQGVNVKDFVSLTSDKLYEQLKRTNRKIF